LITKLKKLFTWLFLGLSVLFFVLLFVFKDKLNSYASKTMQAQAGSEIKISESAFIDSAYNYTKNRLSYEVTFLEFGSKGCSACKRMETVMNEIRTKYPNRVNVIFANIMLPANQRLMKYYGVAAIPTQVFLNKDGKEFFRHTGYYSTEELIRNLTLN
jgi:thiol-disulfide isomerase/thioredoxin